MARTVSNPKSGAPKEESAIEHLDEQECGQAVEHASIRALVIHEVLRKEGEEELTRPASALAWSGLAAGMSMGFSFLGLALMRSALPTASWSRLVDSIGYTIGGVGMVALLNHAPLAVELEGSDT